jgi:hypothetical protein
MWHAWGKREMDTLFKGYMNEKDHLELKGVDGTTIRKMTADKWDEMMWSGLNWLKIGVIGTVL